MQVHSYKLHTQLQVHTKLQVHLFSSLLKLDRKQDVNYETTHMVYATINQSMNFGREHYQWSKSKTNSPIIWCSMVHIQNLLES